MEWRGGLSAEGLSRLVLWWVKSGVWGRVGEAFMGFSRVIISIVKHRQLN